MANVIYWMMRQPKRAIVSFFMLMILKDKYVHHTGCFYGNVPRVSLNEVFPGIESVDITVLKAFDRNVGKSLHIEELVVLCTIVKFTNAKNILEIGTYKGNTTLNLAANTPTDTKITTVDLGPDWDGRLELEIPNSHVSVTNANKIGSQYKSTKHSKKITQIFGDSATIDWRRMPIPFDVVFIDGCHYYTYVKKDTLNAIRHLKSGGILVWHDYGMIKDVSRVVDETAKTQKVKAILGTGLAMAFVE